MTKILTIVGARPQFVKAFPVSKALAEAGLTEVLVHTGQHYDYQMSEVFFEQLEMKLPDYTLDIGSGSHHYQIGEGIKRLEPILRNEKPDIVLVYGDTNGTLAGAIAASSLNLPIAHVEAGLRVFDKHMPEERNRVVTDHLSTWLFVPTPIGMENLKHEGIQENVYLVGDVMLDSLLLAQSKAQQFYPDFVAQQGLQPQDYLLLTMHRAETTENPEAMKALLTALDDDGCPVLFPVHPRSKAIVSAWSGFRNIRFVEPLSYLEMIQAETQAKAIVTDSGGVQKEAAIWGVPCITMMAYTGWVETVEHGFNTLIGLSSEKLREALATLKPLNGTMRAHYGNGEASQHIARILSLHKIWRK